MRGATIDGMLAHAICLLSVLLALAQQGSTTQHLTYKAPAGWTPRAPSSSMRVAEFVLPRAEGDAEDGDTIIFFFGGQGGDVEANITRWVGQMQQPGGKASKDVATRTSKTINGLPVTIVEVGGTYVAEVRPGSTEHFNKPQFHMRAAVVQTPGGPYFVKMLGPDRTMARWSASFDQFLATIHYQ